MKAIVYSNYGSPDVLEYREIDKPVPARKEVLIKVYAAAANPLDVGELKGVPYLFRIVFGLHKPSLTRPARPGVDVAGQVEAVGSGVTQFQPGDQVFGMCITNPHAAGVKVWSHHQGAFADYACAPEATLVLKPNNVTYEQAACVPVAALTALQGLRDTGHLHPGQKVLVHGAGGGVGTFAVQIAKAFGAEVTGVSSTRNLDMVRALGADHVIDYAHEDFTKTDQRYDVIFDCYANHSVSACKRVLSRKGIYVAVVPAIGGAFKMLSRLVQMFVLSRVSSQKLITFLAKPAQPDLTILRELLATGKITPVIDRRYPLREASEAIRYLAEGQHRGKVVIVLENT